MSLCADCFKAADHVGHDYNRFWSQSGGACDCGDPAVMDEKGFCSRHGDKNASRLDLSPAPTHLTASSVYVMPLLFSTVLRTWRHVFGTMFAGRSGEEIGEDTTCRQLLQWPAWTHSTTSCPPSSNCSR